MELTILLALLAIGSIFGVMAAISRDSVHLLPMGGIFLFTSVMLLSSGSIQYQDGYVENTYENSTINQTQGPQFSSFSDSERSSVTTRIKHYKTLGDQYDSVDPANALGVILLAISMWAFILPGYTKLRR